MQQLQLQSQEVQQELATLFSEINDGTWDDDETIINLILEQIQKLNEEDKQSVLNFLHSEYRGREFLQNDNLKIEVEQNQQNIVQFNHQQNYIDLLEKQDFEQIIHLMKSNEFCQENNIPKLVQQNITIIEKIGIKKADFVRLMEDEIKSKEIKMFDNLKILLSFIYSDPLSESDQLIFEQTIGSILKKPIFSVQFYIDQLQEMDREEFDQFVIYTQQCQMKFEEPQQLQKEYQNQDLLFLKQIFTSDLRVNKQNLDLNLSQLLGLENQSLKFQNMRDKLDEFIASQIDIQKCYFIVVWYLWSQYAQYLKICDELKILDQNIQVKKIKEEKRPILFKQSLSKLKKNNDEIFSFFIHRQLYFSVSSKDFLLSNEKYEHYKNERRNFYIQQQALIQNYQQITQLLNLQEENFILLWSQIKQIPLNFLLTNSLKGKNTYSSFLLFLWKYEIEKEFFHKAKIFFLQLDLTVVQLTQELQIYVQNKLKAYIINLISIILACRQFELNDQQLLNKLFIKYNSFEDISILLELKNLFALKDQPKQIIEFLVKLSKSELQKIKFIFNQDQLVNIAYQLLYYHLSNLKKPTIYIKVAFRKLFQILQFERHPQLNCFKILYENINFQILNFILLINNKRKPLDQSVDITLFAINALEKKLSVEEFNLVLANMQPLINQEFYQFEVISELKRKKIDDRIIFKLIKFHYSKFTDNKKQLSESCQYIFENDEHFYESWFQSNNHFNIFSITPSFFKRKIIQHQLPQNMQLALEQFNISLAELSFKEQSQIIIDWSNELNNQEKFQKLIPFFFNIIKRGESSKQLLDLVHNNRSMVSIGHLNMKALFQILYNNSNDELKVMLLKFWSKLNPVPLIYQNPNINCLESEEDLFLFNQNIFYIVQEGYTILNFSLSKKQTSIGKTELINQTFYQMEKFETCDTCEMNKNTIDIMFDLSFNGSRHLSVGDAHGYIPLPILLKILPFFKLWIIQLDTEMELEENYLQIQLLNEVIQVLRPKICFIVRNSNEALKTKFRDLISKIEDSHINLHFILDLTQKGLDKQVISNEICKVSKFLFSQITDTSQECKRGQKQFFEILKHFDNEKYYQQFQVIESHLEIIQGLDQILNELIVKENGFYNLEAFPIRSIEYQIKCLRDQQAKDFSNNEQKNDKLELTKKKIEQLEDQIRKQSPTKLLLLFSKIFNQNNYYILYLWFTDRIRIFNQEQTYQLQDENQKLNEDIQKIKKIKSKDPTKKTIEYVDNDQVNAIKERISEFRKQLEKNLKLLSLRNIGIEIFWREIIQQQQLCQSQNLQLNPADVIFGMIQKGEPFEFLDGDSLKINSQFLKQLTSRFGKKGDERILVLSVLGPQSSGKSTILNKIFGCHFWTSVGRCTKGIYLQLLQVQNREYFDNQFDYILLLDTEGLQNPNQQDPEFDKKIALFVLAVSDIILVNVKGDIHQQFRNLVEMCIYTLGQLKSNFSSLKQISWCFNQNNDVNNKAPFLEQIQSIASNLNAEFSKDGSDDQKIDYNDILEIKKENIQVLGFSSYEKSWKIIKTQIGFDDRDWRQQISNETFSQEAYNYGLSIIKKFVQKITESNSNSSMPNLNFFISNIDSKWNSIQRLPDLLEFSELIYHQQNQFMKIQFENIIKNLDFTFTHQVQTEIFDQVQSYQRQSLEIFNQIQKSVEEKMTQRFELIRKTAESELNSIKQQHQISKKITVKYIKQLENEINSESVQCNLLIYEEIKNYERTYQERQGFAQIETFVSDLSSKPEELKEYQLQGKLIKSKFKQLWKDMITKQEQQQEKLFKDFSDKQFKSITSSFTEYTITSQHQQDYYCFLLNNINKTIPKENLDEKSLFFNLYKKELNFKQFMAIGKSQKNLRFLDIFNQPINQRIKNSSETDLVQIRWCYVYKVYWTVLDLKILQTYFFKPFFDDLCKIILNYKKGLVKLNKLINFFAILEHFKIEYQQDLLEKLILQIKDPSFWSFTNKAQIEDIQQPFQKLISSFIFDSGPIFLQDENFTSEFFSNYPSLKPSYPNGTATIEQEITQQRNDLLMTHIIISEKQFVYPQDYDQKNYQHFLYISNQNNYNCHQNSFLSNFPNAFEQLMVDQKGWENLYFSIYDIIKIEMIDNQKGKQNQNKLKQFHSQESEILSDDDITNYSTSLIKIIMSKIEQEIINYNKQFSNFGVILNPYGERCIYYYSLFIIWQFVCSQKWKIFEKQKLQLENTQKIQFEKFKADIQENKAEQSKLKAQILIKDIYEGFVEKFHQDQSLSASQYIQSKQLSSDQLIKTLDKELLFEFNPKKQQEQTVYEYLTNQQKYIEDYSLIFSQGLEKEAEKQYTDILRKETQQFLEQIKLNADEIKLKITKELKSKEYFVFQQKDQEQNDKYYEQKLYFIVISCLFGEQVQDINLLDDQYKQIFKESNFKKVPKKIIVKYPQQSDQSIQLLKYFISEISIQLNSKIRNIEQTKLNLSNLNIKNKIDEARLKIRGCQFTCPMCKRKCDQDNDHQKHLCQNGHYYRGMNGVLIENKPSLFTCEEIDDEAIIMSSETKKERLWKEIKAMYPEWQFKSLQTNEIEINKAKMKKVWNGGIGQLVCTKLNEIFKRTDITFEIKADFEGQKQVIAENIHYIFMLDDSGSMIGQKWNNVRRGAITCMTDIGRNPNAKVSVIIFNNNSRIAINCQKVDIPNQENLINFQGGGTNFGKAFSSLTELLKIHNNAKFKKIVILFYTDGEATYPAKEIQELTGVSKDIQYIATFIACTEEANAPILSQIVTKLKIAHFQRVELKQSIQTEAINKTWSEIVSDSFHKLKIS